MTILTMAPSTAKNGKARDLVDAARDAAKALRHQPGCVGTFVLLKTETNVQVSISVFDSEADVERALEARRPVIAEPHLENFLEGTPRFQPFDVL